MKRLLILSMTILLAAMLVSCDNSSSESDLSNSIDVNAHDFERTTITLGVINLAETFGEIERLDVRRNVQLFNLENELYQIEVIYYTEDDTTRLRTELVSGRGPDILYSTWFECSIFTPMIRQGMLIDLLPYIDRDPEINREDFFTSIFEAAQNPDGSLALIPTFFYIQSLAALPGVVDATKAFTTDWFLELVRNAVDDGVNYPLDPMTTGYAFLITTLMYVDLGIIDFATGVSDFENQTFFDLLEVALLLPEDIAAHPDSSLFGRMSTGGQVFTDVSIVSFLSFSRSKTLLGDFTFLGYPSDKGGIIGATTQSHFGISAGSKNQETAWSFVRSFLHSDSPMETHFTMPFALRVDKFDEQVISAMGVGEWSINDGGLEIPLQVLSEENINELRSLIDSVSFVARPNIIITQIVVEESSQFLAGTRTADDLVRILQNRVGIYLDERG